MSSEGWTTVESKSQKRNNKQASRQNSDISSSGTHGGSNNKHVSYVPKHMRNQNRNHNRRRNHREQEHMPISQEEMKMIKPKPLLTVEAFPTLGSTHSEQQEPNVWEKPKEIKPETKNIVWVDKTVMNTETLIEMPTEQSVLPEVEHMDIPSIIYRQRTPKPIIQYDSDIDEYYFADADSEDEYIPQEEIEYQETLEQELNESEQRLDDEDLYIFLSSVNCPECNDINGLETEHLHQMCPTGFNAHHSDREYHKQCYICTRCLLEQYAEYKTNSEYHYRTMCGHIVDMAQHKQLIKSLINDDDIIQEE